MNETIWFDCKKEKPPREKIGRKETANSVTVLLYYPEGTLTTGYYCFFSEEYADGGEFWYPHDKYETSPVNPGLYPPLYWTYLPKPPRKKRKKCSD